MGLPPVARVKKFKFLNSIPSISKKGLSKLNPESFSLIFLSLSLNILGSTSPSGNISSKSFLLLISSAASSPSSTSNLKSIFCRSESHRNAITIEQSIPKISRPVLKANPGSNFLPNISISPVDSWKKVSYKPQVAGMSRGSNCQIFPSSSSRISSTYQIAKSLILNTNPKPSFPVPLNPPYNSASLLGNPRSVIPALPVKKTITGPISNFAANPILHAMLPKSGFPCVIPMLTPASRSTSPSIPKAFSHLVLTLPSNVASCVPLILTQTSIHILGLFSNVKTTCPCTSSSGGFPL
mmetsp:Transcript_1311/g.2347  ORF Transcript_1311/g.2347 Transcript_1311/m.2347 type:complete len:296 (-) Transcript_1311:10646-11533(-)